MPGPEPRPVRSDAELLDVIERRARHIWWARRLGTASVAALVIAAAVAAVPVLAGRGEQVVAVAGVGAESTVTTEATTTTAAPPETTTTAPPPETTTTAPAPAPEPDPAPVSKAEGVTPSTEAGAGGTAEPYEWPHCPSDRPTREPPSGMVVELTSDQPAYAGGEEIVFTLTVRNEGDEAVTRESPGTERFDVTVERDGHAIWRHSWAGYYGTTDVKTYDYEPGEAASDDYVWDQRMCDPETTEAEGRQTFRDDPLPPGTYTAHAYVDASGGGWASNTVEFEVT